MAAGRGLGSILQGLGGGGNPLQQGGGDGGGQFGLGDILKGTGDFLGFGGEGGIPGGIMRLLPLLAGVANVIDPSKKTRKFAQASMLPMILSGGLGGAGGLFGGGSKESISKNPPVTTKVSGVGGFGNPLLSGIDPSGLA